MNRAIALITVLIIAFLLFALVGAFLFLAMNARRLNERYHENLIALGLAEAGVDYAIWEINFDKGDFNGWSGGNPKTTTINDFEDPDGNIYGDINISVYDPGKDKITIISEGTMSSVTGPGVSRKIRVLLGEHKIFNYAVLTAETIEIGGNAVIDSYNSSLGSYDKKDNIGQDGDLATKGAGDPAITIFGSAFVSGNAATGPTGTVSIEDSATLSGTTGDNVDAFLPSVSVPDELKGQESAGPLSLDKKKDSLKFEAGNYKYDSLSLTGKGTITLDGKKGPVNLYFTQDPSITTKGKDQIIVKGGEANIYFNGDVNIVGEGVRNKSEDPSNFTLYGTDSVSNINLSDIGEFYGTCYAPLAEYSISGNSDIFGAVAGKKLSLTGNAKIHFDKQLKNDGPGIGYDPYAWQEK